MRKSLDIATRGYLTSTKRTLSISVRGYLHYDGVIPPKPGKEFNKGGAPAKYSKKDNENLPNTSLLLQDDEILTVIKIFIQCQGNVLKN